MDVYLDISLKLMRKLPVGVNAVPVLDVLCVFLQKYYPLSSFINSAMIAVPTCVSQIAPIPELKNMKKKNEIAINLWYDKLGRD